ncbi:sulfotransferase family protein [Rhodopirellula sp. JC639]|uniref:sulfotransferase family protein n=1 Tax=Stieleria mannarensis TaxID=2755585 RepID=UPI001602A5A1
MTTPVVFIVSQPRAGSTLLQTMLSGHDDVHAPGEAWLMLPLVHAIAGSRRDVRSPYDQCLADDAVGEFVRGNLNGGWSELQAEIGRAATRIYEAARARAGAKTLIDKTPRYYWIIEDLLSLIPDCKIIVLRRNPLAVLSSIMETWTRRTRVGFLKDYRGDLLEAPARIAAAMAIQDERIYSLRYEDLVHDPASHLAEMQSFIGLRPVEGLQHYGTATHRAYGDPQGVHQRDAAQVDSVQKYLDRAAARATDWRLMDDYRRHLGPGLLKRLGYDDDELKRHLDAVRPTGTLLAPTLSSQIRPRPAEPRRSVIRLRRMAADAVTQWGKVA